MPAPWENYGSTSAPDSATGATPWAKYGKTAPAAAPAAAVAPDTQSGLLTRILQAIHPEVSGINAAVPQTLGLPGTVANDVVNLIKSGIESGTLATGHLPPTALDPVANAKVPLTGDWLQAKLEQLFPGSTTDPQHPLGHLAGELIGPGGAAMAADRLTAAAPSALESVIGAPSDAAPLATARAGGFKTSGSNVALRNPTQQPGVGNQLAELASGGNNAITRSNNAANTAQATRLAGEQMGLGQNVAKINPPDLKAAKAIPGAVYDAVGNNLGDWQASPNLLNVLKDAQADQSVQSAPAARNAASRLLQTIEQNKGGMNGDTTIGDISTLRDNQATRPIANALEDEIGRQVGAQGSPKTLQQYQAARRQFAQIYTVQEALKGGQVDPAAIGAVHQANPNLLTGNLRVIGTAANELPADMQLPSAPSGGALDALLRGTKGMLGYPARRFLTTTDRFQNQFGPQANAGGRSYFPTFGERPAPPSEALNLSPSPGNAGPTPSQGEMPLPQNPRPLIDLQRPPGAIGEPIPVQGAMALPEGPGSVSGAPMASREASQLIPPAGQAFQPHQPDLFPPQNVRPGAKLTPEAEKLLKALGLGGG